MVNESRHGDADKLSWWLIVAMAVACLIIALHLGFRVDARRAILPGAGVSILGASTIAGHAWGKPRLAVGATAFLQMTLFTVLGVVLAYLVAARGAPLWDDTLMGMDRRLGLDWPAIVRAVDRLPVALWVGGLAYHSLTVQMIVCIVALSATNQMGRLRVAVAAAIGSGFLTVAISAVMPAVGNLFDPAAYRHLWPSVAWMERDLIGGLRDGSIRSLDLGHLMGIVSFPSYHATLPVILSWAQRETRWLRIIAPVWSGVTIVATPLFGGHYGVDVLAGLGLGVVALAIVPVATRRNPRVRGSAAPCASRDLVVERPRGRAVGALLYASRRRSGSVYDVA